MRSGLDLRAAAFAAGLFALNAATAQGQLLEQTTS
jgi:hypothetical protein